MDLWVWVVIALLGVALYIVGLGAFNPVYTQGWRESIWIRTFQILWPIFLPVFLLFLLSYYTCAKLFELGENIGEKF